ncbi:MAG: nucleotide sugar dehydrogenase, partial [Deltaproteobacteria bacterium]|nr:nucleotide sugar dehydrogenase [Deltaproteobacteria bacterium]
DAGEAMDIYGIELKTWDELKDLNGLVVAVPHREYREKPAREFLEKLTNAGCLVDVKAMFDPRDFQDKGIYFWRL